MRGACCHAGPGRLVTNESPRPNTCVVLRASENRNGRFEKKNKKKIAV